jgi:hypothetical protein
MEKFSINISDKPFLKNLMATDKKSASEVINTFVQLMESAAKYKWNELPSKFVPSGELNFNQLVNGILLGALQVSKINPNAYSIIDEAVHPLSILGKREVHGVQEMMDWKDFYKLPSDARVDQETVENIIRNLMHYGRWIDVKTYYDALSVGEKEEVAVWKQMEQNQVALLPFQPALRYQAEFMGELHCGTLLVGGLFDCGEYHPRIDDKCPACLISELQKVTDDVLGCLNCHAGFSLPKEE